jgi:general nucleoside transport system permease protein
MSEQLEVGPKDQRAVDHPPSDRSPVSWVPTVLETLVAVAMALVIGALLIALSEDKVIESIPYIFSYPQDFFGRSWDAISSSYAALVRGSVGSTGAISTTLVRSAPLICAGLGVSLAFRAGLFNIGAQGQLIFGALCAGYVGFGMSLPPGIHLLVEGRSLAESRDSSRRARGRTR